MPREKAPQEPTQPTALPGAFDLFKPNWAALKVNPRAIILYATIPSVLGALITLTGDRVSPLPKESAQVSDLVNALSTPYYITAYGMLILVSVLIAPATTVLLVKSARGEKSGLVSSFVQGLKFLPRMTGLSLLYIVAFAIGLALVLAPSLLLIAQAGQPSGGNVLALLVSIVLFMGVSLFIIQRVLLSQYYLVDRNLSIIKALKTCWNESKKQSVAVWGLLGVIFLVNMAVGLVSSIPYIGVVIGIAATLTYIAAPAIRYLQVKEVTK